MNYIVAEISLLLEQWNCHLTFEHYRTEAHAEADAHSRLAEGKAVPARLRHINPSKVADRAILFQAWPDHMCYHLS